MNEIDDRPDIREAYLSVKALPWRPRWRGSGDTFPEVSLSDGPGLDDVDDPISALFAIIGLLLFAVVLLPAIVGIAILSIELPLVLALMVLIAVARFLGLMPWNVEVVTRSFAMGRPPTITVESYR